MEEINCFGIKRKRPVRCELPKGTDKEYPNYSEEWGQYKVGNLNGIPLIQIAPPTDELIAHRRIVTTYDFGTKTFGHASMLIGPFKSALDPALRELQKARKRYAQEMEKARNGEDYDEYFITGMRGAKIYFGGKK